MSRSTTSRRLAVDVRAERGVTLVELLVALGLTSLGVATLALVSTGVIGGFEAEPAAAEQQQRGRTTMTVLADDLARAGTGFVGDPQAGAGWAAPAVVPELLRSGAWAVTPQPSTFSVIAGARTAAHARLQIAVTSGESRLLLERPGFCSAASPTCRFAAGDHVMLADGHGGFAIAAVAAVAPPLIVDLAAPLSQAFPASTVVSVLDAHGYTLRPDAATGLRQLVRAVGPGTPTALVDFVERFTVDWIVDGAVPTVALAPDGTLEAVGHGPMPPEAGVVGDPAWPPGENCAFARDAAGASVSRLAELGAAATVVPLSAFADGPWCPSAAAATRWDADLTRVVGVRLRLIVAVASASLRAPLAGGPAGRRIVPSLTFTTVVAPGRAGSRR